MESEQKSEGGHPIKRYGPREKPFEPVSGNPRFIELVSDHIEKHLGAPSLVFHEIVSDLVHLDIHIIPPRPDRDFYTLITSGMSERAMKAPEGLEDFTYAELMIGLPPEWPLGQEDFKDERNYWPIRLLKTLARFPHEFDTWLFESHTFPNGDPPEPYADNTELCCALLAFPVTVPEGFREFQVTPEIAIHFLAVVPLYREEMEYKLKKDSDALFKRFDAHQVTERLDIKRPNVAKKKSWKFW